MRGSLVILSLLAAQCDLTHAAFSGAGNELFTNPTVRRISITIPQEGLAVLRTNSRTDIAAVVREGSNAFERVAVHLKGSTGSFRKIDDKPGFTLDFDRYAPGQRFYGLSKIHLNNSVEDPTYLNEFLGSDLFMKAGIPATRAGHAIVELNGRRLGLYVLKEGFTPEFLALHFRHPAGNLYEPGQSGHDVDEPLDHQLGPNAEAGRDLEVLAAAASEPALPRRWQQLQRILDVDRFITFMAMEILTGHRDGYCLARNNFRVYHDVDSARLMFFPHGMDQLFGNPRATVNPRMNGLAARAVMEVPEGRKAYRRRCLALFTNLFRANEIHHTIDQATARIRPVLTAEEAGALDRETAAFKQRIADRIADVAKQFAQSPIELLRFEKGIGKPDSWQAYDPPAGGLLEQTNAPGGKSALMIRAGPVTSASWRAKVLLPPGRYVFQGRLKAESVDPLDFGRNHGAVLRVMGVSSGRPSALLKTQPWTVQNVAFETRELEQEIEVRCELRAKSGTAWFDLESLRIVRQ